MAASAFTANFLECDIFHALSGSALSSGRCAQKHGSRYVCDCGSSHICFQDEILRKEFDREGLRFPGVDRRIIEAEQAEYEIADAITVPLLVPFLNRTKVQFRGDVPQLELAKVMSESNVLVLPSIEDGAALVRAQAMASSGCPVIATTNTRAEDLFRDA